MCPLFQVRSGWSNGAGLVAVSRLPEDGNTVMLLAEWKPNAQIHNGEATPDADPRNVHKYLQVVMRGGTSCGGS